MKKAVRNQRHQQRQRASSGFTLIEVSVASLITFIGLLSVAQLFMVAGLINRSSKQTTLASILAKRRMEALMTVPLTHADVQYQGALNASGQPTGGTSENYYVDFDRQTGTDAQGKPIIQKGTGQVSTAVFYTGQPVTYQVTWAVLQDSVAAGSGAATMAGLRRLIVRAEAQQAALIGSGQGSGSVAREFAQLSTIRTPPQ